MQINVDFFNSEDLLVGFHLMNGVSEDGEDLVIFSIGFLIGSINFITKR